MRSISSYEGIPHVKEFIQRRWLHRSVAHKCFEMSLLLCTLHIFTSDQIKEERNKKCFCFFF